jgi:hypothetical protein
VKIKGIDRRNGREFLAEQVIASGGTSPWDGQPFSSDYAATLVNALRDAEEAGTQLEEALEQIADVAPEFSLDRESVIGPLRVHLDRLEQNLVRRG